MAHEQDGLMSACPPPRRPRQARAALFKPKANARALAADEQVWRADAQSQAAWEALPPHTRVQARAKPPVRHDCSDHAHGHTHGREHEHGAVMHELVAPTTPHMHAHEVREAWPAISSAPWPAQLSSAAAPRPSRQRRVAPGPAERAQMPAFAMLPDARIHVPCSAEDFAHARQALLSAHALGFDTESKPLFHPGQRDTGPHVVQLATPTDAWLLQLHHPQALELTREVMAAPHIAKVGFGLDNDRRSLPHRLGAPLANVHDLDRVFAQHGYGRNLGVRGAVAVVLRQDFHKSKRVSTSNWSAPTLSSAQLRYAANDAHAPAMLWAALPAWEARQTRL